MKHLPIKKIFLISLGLWLVGISGCGDSQVSVSITPTKNVTVPTDQTFLFTTGYQTPKDLAVTWSIDQRSNSSLGNINPDSDSIHHPPSFRHPNTAKIRVTSQADSSSSDSVTVTIVSETHSDLEPTSRSQTIQSRSPGQSCAGNELYCKHRIIRAAQRRGHTMPNTANMTIHSFIRFGRTIAAVLMMFSSGKSH